MHVLDEIRVDGAGRICITNVFDEMPKEVLILYDTEENAVYFRGDITGDWSAAQRKIDSKNRVILPKWIRDKTGDEFYLTPESKQKHCLVAKNKSS